MWNCVCVFKPSGKGKRLPEVHCIVSKLGCFNLFAKVSEAHKRPLPSFYFMERWKAAAVAEVGRVSELLSLNGVSVPKPVRVNTSRWWSRCHIGSSVFKRITCSLRNWNHLSASILLQILEEVERRREVAPALVYPFMRSVMEAPFPAPGRTVTVKSFLPGSGNEVMVNPKGEMLISSFVAFGVPQNGKLYIRTIG